MKPTDTTPSTDSTTRKPDTRPAEVPDDFGESDSPPKTTRKEDPPEREDREAVPPDGRSEEASGSKLERCEKTIHEHLRGEIEFSRAAREIIDGRLYTEKGFESLGAYTKATFGVRQNQFRKYGYYAKVFDIIEENREEIAERGLTDVRDVPLPRVKAWTRPLHSKANKGLVEEVIETWAAVVRRHGSSITGDKVEDIRDEVLGEGKDSEEDSENSGDSEDESSEEDGDSSSGEDPSDSSDGTSDGDTEGDGTDGSGDDDSGDGNPGDGNPGDDDPSEGSSSGDSDEGEGDEPDGFSVDLPSGFETRDEASVPEGGITRAGPTKANVEELARKAEEEEEGFSCSSAEHMVASKVWKVLVPSPFGVGAGLPEKASEEEPVGVVLKPGRLDQITGLAPGHDRERVLVCPGVDLFGEVVPDGAIEAILDRCRKTEHTPVVFTRRLGRASGFDLSDLWVGTPADHSCLEDREQALCDAAPDAAVRWLLYDVEKGEDTESPPSFSSETDWLVYDPPGGAGVSLTVAETQSLVEAAEESGTDWAFRSTFKTCGDSGPSEGDAEERSADDRDEGSGSDDGPNGENGAV